MRAVLAAVLALAAPTAALSQTTTVDAVLAANRAAVGETPASGVARLEYVQTASGLTGPLVDRFDLATGAYVETEEASGIADAKGYDGRLPWQRDISGANTVQEGGDRIPVAVSAAYRFANLWWRADRGGAEIAYVGRETSNGRSFDHLVVTPKGGKRFDAWFDADTHLLAKIAEDQQFLHVIQSFDDYRPENGVVLAHKFTVDEGMGEGGISRATLARASFGPAEPLSAYAMPTEPPTGASITGGAASTTVPFKLLNNHVYVQGYVNGKGPFTFIVDTGGHTLLSARVVKEAGLQSVGEAISSGAGDGHSTTGFVHFDEIAIGGVRLRDQTGFATEIYDKSIEGIPVDGMIGFELIRRMVTQIDYGRRTITFTDPARFRATADLGVAIPFVFYDHLPNITGSIDGRPARFDIDTGSRTELDVTSPFVAAQGLRAQFRKGTSAITGWGVGGPARDYVVRLPTLKLGPVEVDGVAAGLSEAKGGSISDPNYEGNVGSGLLKRFVVTFDYARQVLYLKPITPTPADIGTFDRSGFWINAAADGYKVTAVSDGGPAQAAGIEAGDLITAIDGAPVRPEALSDVRMMLRNRPAGSKVRLEVVRGQAHRSIELVLRDQI